MNGFNLTPFGFALGEVTMVQSVGANLILPILFVAVLLAGYRLLRGPSLPDRVVALDLMGAIGVAIAATYSLVTGQEGYLDVAMVLALISFLGTVAFAIYLKRSV